MSRICVNGEWKTISGKKNLSLSDLYLNLDLPVIGIQVYCDGSALYHKATEMGVIAIPLSRKKVSSLDGKGAGGGTTQKLILYYDETTCQAAVEAEYLLWCEKWKGKKQSDIPNGIMSIMDVSDKKRFYESPSPRREVLYMQMVLRQAEGYLPQRTGHPKPACNDDWRWTTGK
uniref:Uncharacterized protein n=1 Tax=Timema poppense TaxID=170557 RepID=A0A7R9CPL6_TIMPO|nr:unnamed protein product [Timema poppensis]